MSIGVRLFHSRNTLKNYILVKPTESQCFLYGLNKDGTIDNFAKPLLKKTYEKYSIVRKGAFPCVESFKDTPHRYNIWESRVPRNINEIPDGMSQMFSIKNKDGNSGAKVHIIGSINKKGIESVDKLQFPLSGYDLSGITNLARIYLKKIFNMYTGTEPNKNTYYISEEFDKILSELDKQYNIPKFEITNEIKNSINLLLKKHKMS